MGPPRRLTRKSLSTPSKRAREPYQEQRPRVQEALDEYWLKADGNERVSIRKLAVKYEIRRTLLTQLVQKGLREVMSTKPGRSPSLCWTGQCLLAAWVMSQQAIGYSVTRSEIQRKGAELQALTASAPAMKCAAWMRDFFNTFPFLAPRQASSLCISKAQAANKTSVHQFFMLYASIIKKHEVITVYNVDETFLSHHKLSFRSQVVGIKGSKNTYRPTSNLREHVTVIEAISNHGSCLPALCDLFRPHDSGRYSGGSR